jgi:hypothetical protein
MHKSNKTHNQSKVEKKWYQKWWGILIIIFIGMQILAAAISSYSRINNRSSTQNNNQPMTTQQPAEPEKPRDPDTLDVSVSSNGANIVITNNEAKNFVCDFILNQDYTYGSSTSGYSIKSGVETKIGIGNFTKDDGTRFNIFYTKPQSLRMNCDRVNGDSGTADVFWD